MRSKNSCAPDATYTFYPKFLRHFLPFAVPFGLFVGWLIMAEVNSAPHAAKKGAGYFLAPVLVVAAFQCIFWLINQKIVITSSFIRIEPIFLKNREADSIVGAGCSYEWQKIAVLKQRSTGGRDFQFYTADGELYGTISCSSWRHSKKLKALIRERVQQHGGKFEQEPPPPHIPFSQRLANFAKRFIQWLKGRVMPR